MPNSYRISLFDDGLHQVLTIPSEFSLPGRDVLLRKEGDRLIIEPIKPCSLLSVLATLDSLTNE
ncbi:AbrB/MazE/SpoVT family DNA-binding domain-containing protein [Oscillatoria sp. FACHB-1406]|uniref:antitoxin n=1 Tax=Oscillatoria sp. FACHB-1406 TaxID=2692846 RepID=UPI001684B50E|nr:AbrB/MazE/SpoVT family DNA-binding domain-containing protein [Oscillatoria sp. FACHB-1406]MBD2578008.1 AbrB/MazE/SpoVT family DNA-binding domain-containing protein [Oscillatoria sp. FACHB-1406]